MRTREANGYHFAGTGLFYSFIASVVTVITIYRIGSFFSDSQTISAFLPLLAIMALATVAGTIPFLFRKSNWGCVVGILGGVPVGVIADTTWDLYVNSSDRNLFPLEIILWWLGTGLPVIAGYGIGRLISRGNPQREERP